MIARILAFLRNEYLLTDEIGNRDRRKDMRERRRLARAAYVEAEVLRMRAARERMS